MRYSKSDFFVDPDISRAETLPAAAFTDPEYLELELQTVFARMWLLVPESSGWTSRAIHDP